MYSEMLNIQIEVETNERYSIPSKEIRSTNIFHGTTETI
jgi:hypothetical protein